MQHPSQHLLVELENLYRNLALESRKSNTNLKTASERSIFKIREFRNASKSSNTSNINISNDIIIRPLILAWSSRNIPISLISLNILQKLLTINYISINSLIQILISLRSLLFIISTNANIQIKICQILIQIPTNIKTLVISKIFIQNIMYLVLFLCQSKEPSVRQISLAALQQITTVTLEYCTTTSIDIPQSITQPIEIFECLFHDLCCFASPQLLYLKSNQSNNEMIDIENDHPLRISAVMNATSVSYSSIIENKKNSNSSSNSSSMNVSLMPIDLNVALVTNLNHSLSKLRLLKCDFVIDHIYILELLEMLISSNNFPLVLKNYNILQVVKYQLCPLICDIIEKCDDFEDMIHVARIVIQLSFAFISILHCFSCVSLHILYSLWTLSNVGNRD